jgi:hypothetical protein
MTPEPARAAPFDLLTYRTGREDNGVRKKGGGHMSERRMVVAAVAVLAVSGAATGTAGALLDLPIGFLKFAPLKPGVYQPSLFSPSARFTVPDGRWNGAQWVKDGHGVVVLSWKAHNGGWEMHSTPSSTQSTAATLHRLETERAAGTNVGIQISPAVAVTFGGFHGWQFDGTVIGKYGHTWVPFQGVNGGKPDNGDRTAHNVAFRIIVLDVHGHAIFFEIDSDSPQQEPVAFAASMKMIHSLRFG